MGTLENNQTWELTIYQKPKAKNKNKKNQSRVDRCTLYTIKYNLNGRTARYQEWLMAKGFAQISGEDHSKAFAHLKAQLNCGDYLHCSK